MPLGNDSDTALDGREESGNDLRRNTAGGTSVRGRLRSVTPSRSDVCLERRGGAGSREETGMRHTGPYGSYSSCTVGLSGEF